MAVRGCRVVFPVRHFSIQVVAGVALATGSDQQVPVVPVLVGLAAFNSLGQTLHPLTVAQAAVAAQMATLVVTAQTVS
tara:strand:+ start:195 stop:428 length:234 start_codon:yes stop_codon:yes gene_type:complete